MATPTTTISGTFSRWARRKKAREQERLELSIKVIEGLKGDALKCAMDLGREEVVAADGVL